MAVAKEIYDEQTGNTKTTQVAQPVQIPRPKPVTKLSKPAIVDEDAA